MVHILKTHPEPFKAVRVRQKTFEFRKADRPFRVADALLLKEWDPATEQFTGEEEIRTITYILTGPKFGLPDDYCVMAIV